MKQRLLLMLISIMSACCSWAGHIYVSVDGNDANNGTSKCPVRSVHQALRIAREWRRQAMNGDAETIKNIAGGIEIHIGAGRYYMTEPLFLRPEDSGTADSPTLIRGEESQTVICGDARQTHTQIWPKEDKASQVRNGCVANVDVRQEKMERMLDFNPKDRTITIPTPPKYVLKTKRLEMVVHQRWAIAILRVKEMKVEGGKTIVSFMEPESRLEFEHPWPQPIINGEKGSSAFLLRTTEQRDGIEQLAIIDGANYITFKNLVFKNTCWNRPLHKGHVTLQGGFPLVDAYKLKEKEGLPWDDSLENQAWTERPTSAVTIRNAHHIDFESVEFSHLASTALDFVDCISDCNVAYCGFKHIGGTAIMAGSFAESPLEVHRPYENLAEHCQRIKIEANQIFEAAEEDWGTGAISCGYVRDCTISNNIVYNTNYSGICVGWGWTPHYTGMENNRIVGNKVFGYAYKLYDAGGIYTLSNQPNSCIKDNEIYPPYPAPYATNSRGFRIYLDAHTDGFTIENNRTPVGNTLQTQTRPIRRDEIGDNHPGHNLIFNQ